VNGLLGTIDSLAALPLERAMERTGVGLAACDAEGRLTLLSPVLQDLFGIPFAPVPEEDYAYVFHLLAEDCQTPLAYQDNPLVRARRGEYVRDALLATRRLDGRLVHLRCNAAPLEDGFGESAGALVLVQDVTLEREAEQASERVRQQVVEAINHEFRTPLAALLGHVELVREHQDLLPDDVVASLEAIERAGWRLRDLVRTVTDLVDAATASPEQ
jgi:PAS domain S-box-containing protein